METTETTVKMQVCKGCGVEKPETEFYLDNRVNTGKRIAQCKDCKRAYGKQRPKREYEVEVEGEKVCKDCKLTKPIVGFPVNRAVKSGHQPRCSPCHNLWMNTKRRSKGAIFKPIAKSDLIPEHTEYKTALCEVCSAPYSLVRHTGRHKRCVDCSVIVRKIHIHLGHKRNGKDVASDTNGSLVELAVGIARMYISQDSCAYCGDPFTDNNLKHIDHIKPICSGGMHCLSNIAICCKRCNFSKNRYSLLEWLETCRLVAAHANPDYAVFTVETPIPITGRHCEVCAVDISDLRGNAKYCLRCKETVRHINSSLTSGRGSKANAISIPCTRTIVIAIARRWLIADVCCYCTRPFSEDRHKSLDHIIPMCIVKENQANNIAISCLQCNHSKQELFLADWIALCQKIVANYHSAD